MKTYQENKEFEVNLYVCFTYPVIYNLIWKLLHI